MSQNEISKAQRKIEKAYFELLETTHYSKISVSQLIKIAGVSRTTFYRHYTDIFDLYNKSCEHIATACAEHLINFFSVEKDSSFSTAFYQVIEDITYQRKYLKCLCGENGSRDAFVKAFDVVDKCIKNSHYALNEQEAFAVKFLTCGGIGAFVQSVMSNEDYFKEYLTMCKSVLTLVSGGILNNGQGS